MLPNIKTYDLEVSALLKSFKEYLECYKLI